MLRFNRGTLAVQRDKPVLLSALGAGGGASFVSPFNLNSKAPLRRATGETIHASSKTWNKTARPAQKAAEARQGLFPYKGEALPLGQRSGEPLAALHLSRPPHAQTRLPHFVDPAHRGRRAQ